MKCLFFRLNDALPENKYWKSLEKILENAISSCVTRQNIPRFLEYFSSQGFLRRARHFESVEDAGNEVGFN